MEKKYKQLVEDVLVWYWQYGRNLPWRHTGNPYHILVSEVMLQQTQVDRVLPKYRDFLRLFPSVTHLAKAHSADVIRAWKGLGYNRRALFLHKAAQTIERDFGGCFPHDLTSLKVLPGVGDYTARAILSFAYNESVAVIDTNHRKFYSRVFFKGLYVKDVQLLERAQLVINFVHSPFDWNQALMDFMSAVARRDPHPLVVSFDRRYPQMEKKVKRKKSIRFEDTDRFVRGRIMDILRDHNTVSLVRAKEIYSYLEESRFQSIVLGLERDGLIKMVNSSMVLPV